MSQEWNDLFDAAIARLGQVGGVKSNSLDYTVFEDAGRLLYEGSFVSERVSGIQAWWDDHPAPAIGSKDEDVLLPEIRSIYHAAATSFKATDAWNDLRKQMESQRLSALEFRKFQV